MDKEIQNEFELDEIKFNCIRLEKMKHYLEKIINRLNTAEQNKLNYEEKKMMMMILDNLINTFVNVKSSIKLSLEQMPIINNIPGILEHGCGIVPTCLLIHMIINHYNLLYQPMVRW